MCVQNLDDSRGLAIRITYRISLRSSSLWEPRHPLLKVVMIVLGRPPATTSHYIQILVSFLVDKGVFFRKEERVCWGIETGPYLCKVQLHGEKDLGSVW